MAIDLVQLRTFVAVAEEQHLTRAAERLHISQSAASTHVRAIEESLDMRLFVRTNRSLVLTRAGEMLLRKARSLLNEATLFTSFARELRGKVEGDVVIGSSSEPLANRIGDVVAALRANHPLVQLDLRGLPSFGTRQGLKTGELDVGLLLGHPVDAEFAYHDLGPVEFRIAGPVAWKEQIERADWAELAAMPWITPTGSTLAHPAMLAQLFGDRGLELNSVVHFDNAVVARALLPAGVGMMLLREEYALQGEREGYLAVSPIARTHFSLLLAHLASRRDDPLIRAVVDAVQAAWPEMKPLRADDTAPPP